MRDNSSSRLKTVAWGVVFALLITLSACASYSGSNLKPGVATLGDVIATMGEPAMRWQEADGREQLAFPRGPAGTQTFMVFIDAQSRLTRIEGVLTMDNFAKIKSGEMTQDDILKLIGPPQPHWTVYFKARDELVWQWLFCDSHSQMAFFNVLFDGTTGAVRTTMQSLADRHSGISSSFCGR